MWGVIDILHRSAYLREFSQREVFAVNMADYTALTVVKNLRRDIHLRQNRYIKTYRRPPRTPPGATPYKANSIEYPTTGPGRIAKR